MHCPKHLTHSNVKCDYPRNESNRAPKDKGTQLQLHTSGCGAWSGDKADWLLGTSLIAPLCYLLLAEHRGYPT